MLWFPYPYTFTSPYLHTFPPYPYTFTSPYPYTFTSPYLYTKDRKFILKHLSYQRLNNNISHAPYLHTFLPISAHLSPHICTPFSPYLHTFMFLNN